MSKLTWSYSAIQMFKQCPHKYYRLRIKKDVTQPETEVLRYGTAVHKAAELYIRDGTPLGGSYEFLQGPLDKLKAIPGKKYCELKLGLTADLEPCEFFAKDVWLRAVVDLVIKEDGGKEARIIDYKTGKSARYADITQLDLMALVVFKHFPSVERIRAGLMFVVCDEFVKSSYTREDESVHWVKWFKDVSQLQAAIENDVWNKVPNFTCYGCPVTDCEHWKPSRHR